MNERLHPDRTRNFSDKRFKSPLNSPLGLRGNGVFFHETAFRYLPVSIQPNVATLDALEKKIKRAKKVKLRLVGGFQRFPKCVCLIGSFPPEVRVSSTEVPKHSCFPVNRSEKLQMLDNCFRSHVKMLFH